MRGPRRHTLLALLLAAGCAAHQPSAPPMTEVDRDARAIRVLEQELYGTAAAPAAPECARACELSSRICELARRICAIAQRNPEDADARMSCQDAHARCARARTHVLSRCTCAP
ncbi:MAG TPA: hypothetical protein VKN99_02785 [Polyangia bacterium]|nr:hypothetical protein [Polyangia bacterium]